MSLKEPRVFVSFFFIGGTFIVHGVRQILKRRRVQDTASNLIAYAPQGNIEVEAYAWSLDNRPLKTSDGKYCAYYRVELQSWDTSEKTGRWLTEWKHIPTNRFLVIDHTGMFEISTEKAEMTARQKAKNWNHIDKSSEISKQIIDQVGKIKTGWFSKKHRLLEKYIPIGSPCYLQGELQTSNRKETFENPSAIKFQSYLKKKLLKENHKNLEFDKNKDGKIEPMEIQSYLYKVAKKLVDDVQTEHASGEALNLNGYMKSSKYNRLIISDMHEFHLLNHLDQKNIVKIVVGSFLVAIGIIISLV